MVRMVTRRHWLTRKGRKAERGEDKARVRTDTPCPLKSPSTYKELKSIGCLLCWNHCASLWWYKRNLVPSEISFKIFCILKTKYSHELLKLVSKFLNSSPWPVKPPNCTVKATGAIAPFLSLSKRYIQQVRLPLYKLAVALSHKITGLCC